MSQPVHKNSLETPSQIPQQPVVPNKNNWGSLTAEVISGGIGGAAGIVAATPFMHFKMHMQQKAANPQSPPSFEKNPKKWFAGGKGLAMWMFPQAAFTFTMNEWMRKKLSNDGAKELTSLEKLACSSATGSLLTLLVAPQELIWTQQKKAEDARLKMIEQHQLDPKVPSKTATQITQEIWKKQGFKGFYRAGGETALREMVSASVLTYLAAEHPFLAPVLGAAISQPLDGRKTNKQADFNYKASLKELFRVKAFSGLLVGRIPIYLVFMNVAPRVKQECEKLIAPKAKEDQKV